MTQPLLGRRSRGDLVAELYDRHAAGLFAYCHDQLGDPGAAAAVLAAVFAAVEAAGPRATVGTAGPPRAAGETLAPHAAGEAAGPYSVGEAAGPPRAALYALARREIQHRDVVHAPPIAGADLVAAFVGRVLRDLRPHQREVLYLSGVCEMDAFELSWVLDVAADTADELTVSACRRFAQALRPALASMRVPDRMAEVFGALDAAPIRDVLARAPWAVPPPDLRAAVLGVRPDTAPATPVVRPGAAPASPEVRSGTASAAPGIRPGTASASRPSGPPLRRLWPAPPVWPLPPSETDALTSTTVFPLPIGPAGGPRDGSPGSPGPSGSPILPGSPGSSGPSGPTGFTGFTGSSGHPGSSARDRASDPFSPPDPDVVSAHEATTEPMPRLKDAVLTSLDDMSPRARRARLRRPSPRGSAPLSAPVPGDVLEPEASPSPPSSSPSSPPSSPSSPDGFPSVGNLFQPLTPEARAALIRTDRLVAAAPREERDRDRRRTDRGRHERREEPDRRGDRGWREDAGRRGEHERPLPGWPLRADELEDLTVPGSTTSPVQDRTSTTSTAQDPTARTDAAASPYEDAGRTPLADTGDVPHADAGPVEAVRAPRDEWPIVDWTAPERPVRVHGLERPADTGWPLSGQEPEPEATAETTGLRTTAAETQDPRTTDAATTDFQEVAAWRAGMLANAGNPGNTGNAEVGATAAAVTGVRADVPEPSPRASRTARSGGRSHRRPRRRPGRHAERHHDWVWELVGFLICVAIAVIVFLAMPALAP
ncbi:hypothetical protein [Streptosporangium pseudovulgare]|uniref:RNA polymerase sigma factor 70 region 4 type 2 domain-containing protein n=1 Tax=Streptosporangium pseudovulgare TaxID=35765 RepID=A0ABQ2QX10_9ACTN|nr:hypothetical protein [Streptosporangium pseudovulgare]GGQ02153.1 hypothetical protein GCM10010140_35230 [Streptosporangium pseudovulgare]